MTPQIGYSKMSGFAVVKRKLCERNNKLFRLRCSNNDPRFRKLAHRSSFGDVLNSITKFARVEQNLLELS